MDDTHFPVAETADFEAYTNNLLWTMPVKLFLYHLLSCRVFRLSLLSNRQRPIRNL
ncbi:hypothetical protein HMPREF1981_02902 [Bacteroides pyogenes F0041]|uniref:Uncharacterized protein n=1 Tax=Bacteroides pyogenes F0041 TaxID=1321819 RepID=U2DPV5_9BACE|nr:hypothetical protein HMPREF1981_02902 [Bacteroides pyogenes F0041]